MSIQTIGNSTQMLFGNGNIDVFHGVLQHPDVHGVVGFIDNGSHQEVGVTELFDGPPHLLDANKIPVRMIFENVESIDAVISALQAARNLMTGDIPRGLQEFMVGKKAYNGSISIQKDGEYNGT